MAVGAAKLGIDGEERLDVVVAGRELGEACYRVSGRGGVKDRGFSRLKSFHIYSEERNSARVRHRLVSETALPDRRDLGLRADNHIGAASDRPFVEFGRKGDLDAGFGSLRSAGGEPEEGRRGQEPAHQPAACPSRRLSGPPERTPEPG